MVPKMFVVALLVQVCVLAATNATTSTLSTSPSSTQSTTQSTTPSTTRSSTQTTVQSTAPSTSGSSTQTTIQSTTSSTIPSSTQTNIGGATQTTTPSSAQNATQSTAQGATQNTAQSTVNATQNATASASTGTSTAPPVLTTSAAPPAASVQGSFRMTVADPSAFCADPLVQAAMLGTVAGIANVSVDYVEVSLTAARRLASATAGAHFGARAGLRRLSGSVTTAYVITIPAAVGNSGNPPPNLDDVQDALSSVNATTLTSLVHTALMTAAPNSTYDVTVTSILPATVVLAPASTTTLLRQAMASGAQHVTAAIGLGTAAAIAALLLH